MFVSRSVLLLTVTATLRAQLPVFEAPPTAMTQSVEVADGGRIDIRLATTGAPAGKTLDIQIRLRPTKGRLDPVQVSVAGDGGTVAYTHNPSSGAGYDTFTYTVQRAGGPVSPPATVSVRIFESPSQLAVAMTRLDFGAVSPGDVGTRQSLVLANLGGGVSEGWLSPPPPWRVEGSQSYRLGRGERQSFTLVFQPTAAGKFTGELRFGAGANQTALLSGIGIAPQRMDPADGPRPLPPNPAQQDAPPGPAQSPAEPRASDADANMDGLGGGPSSFAEWFPRESGGEMPISRVEALVADDANVVLLWPAPTPPAAAYRVEMRRSVTTARKLEVTWVPVAASFETPPGEASMVARIHSLGGGRTHCLRVVALNDEGQLRGYSASLDVAVRAAPLAWPGWLTALGVCAIVIFAVASRRRLSWPGGKA